MGAVAVVGAFPLVLGGIVAYLAGAFGLQETRRLRRVGVPVRALIKCRPAALDGSVGVRRPLLQFATKDGTVMEVFSPVCSTRSRPLGDGQHVRVAYDPDDPGHVLVSGRERLGLEYAFLALGAFAVLAGLATLTMHG